MAELQSTSATEIPKTFAAWQFALQSVKHLYVQGSYDACIDQCEILLQMPQVYESALTLSANRNLLTMGAFQARRLHRAFLHFYAATSHELLAEAEICTNEAEHLQAAKRQFTAAADILSAPESSTLPAETDDHASSVASSATTLTPNKQYQENLKCMRESLEYHAQWVRNRYEAVESTKWRNLESTMTEQLSREEQRSADLKRRIAQGKARGWSRKRFDPTRTRELAKRVLDEI